MSETALYHQIGLLQQELAHAKQIIEELTVERNKFRSQAMMRANKIETLSNEINKIYTEQEYIP
jgi:coenzyme F420-reducing hydrogenase delta subunit